MKKRIVIAVVLFSLFAIFLSGCEENGEDQVSTTVYEPESAIEILGPESIITLDTSEGEVGIMFITSEEKYYLDERQEIAKKKFSKIVESGKYDIIAVKTIYQEGYFIAAEIYYRK